MQQFQKGTNRELARTPRDQANDLKGGAFDMELLLPISLIRQHTKTEDIPAVSDAQLHLYRRAALQAAEKYTGLLLRERKVITEAVSLPATSGGRRAKPFFYHTAEVPFAQPMAYYYGHRNEPPVMIPVVVGDRHVKLPMIIDDFGLGCCNPCATPVQARLMYTGGFGCEDDIPAAIALGALKYIAHVMENPGDIVVATSEAGGSRGGVTVDKTANPAWASGAIEIWRSCKDDAI